jgi:competence protein ComEC
MVRLWDAMVGDPSPRALPHDADVWAVAFRPDGGKDTKGATVYVTKTGSKYHCEGCRFLSKSKIPIGLEEARKKYEPCSVCKPPR